MTKIESIITLARRYCIENYDYWIKKYLNEESGQMYSNNDYNLFPRYNVLNAILQGIEEIINKNFKTINQCKIELINIGKKSQTVFTENINNEIAKMATLEERNKFVLYIQNISENNLNKVSPLPYNRKLRKNESEKIREKLHKVWNFDGGYWKHSNDENEIIFLMNKFIIESDKKTIIEYIMKHEKRFFKIDEMDNNYETETLEIDGCETVYTSKNFNWIIYISHEMYVVFGGELLLGFVKKLFHNKKDKMNKYEW